MIDPEARLPSKIATGPVSRGWRRLVDVVGGSPALGGTVAIAAATGAGQLLTIVASPFITRLYTPSDYGAFSVAGAILALLTAVACLRYELAIPLPKDDSGAAHVLAVCLLATTGICVALVPIALLAATPLLAAIGAAAIQHGAWVILAGVFAGGGVAAFGFWLVRTKSYREIAVSRITQSGASVASQLALGLLGAGATGLLLGYVLGGFAALAQLGRAVWRSSAAPFRSLTARETRLAAIRFRRFPLFSMPSVAVNVLGLQAPLLWVVAAYGADIGGQFAIAQRIVALPIAVLAGAVGQVFFSEAAELAKDRPNELPRLFRRTTRMLVLTASAPFLVGMVLAPFLFPVIFGEPWRVAGLYVAVLAPSYFLQYVTWPTGGTLDVLERQDLHLVRELARLLLLGGVVILATMLKLTAFEAVVALSAMGCLMSVLYGYTSWRAIQHARSQGWR